MRFLQMKHGKGLFLAGLFLLSCSKGMVNFLNETDPRRARLSWNRNPPQYISGAGAGNYMDLEWLATNDGSYVARLGGDCQSGVQLASGGSGSVAAREVKTIRLHSSALQLGDNSIVICYTPATGAALAISVVIHRDDTPPITTASVGPGDYGTSQSLVLTCTDTCLKTVYTTDASTPAVAADGTIITGLLYTGPISLPNPSQQTVKFLSVDKAGNTETTPQGGLYRIDSVNPTLAIDPAFSGYYLSAAGHTSSTFTWTTDRPGVAYDVRLDVADCTSGTPFASGTTAASNTFTLNATDLSSGTHTLRICSKNYVGVWGSVSAAFERWDTPPTSVQTLAAGNHTANPTTVTLSCSSGSSGGCSIAYTAISGTSAGTPADPTIGAADTITTGTSYPVGGFIAPDQKITTVKFTSFDRYGNREGAIHSVTYNVDSVQPTLTFGLVSTYYLSANGHTTATIPWTSNRVGTPYSIRRDSTTCSDGTQITSGTTAASNTLTLNATDISAGTHNLRVCSQNFAGTWGSVDAPFYRWDNAPTTTNTTPAGNFSGTTVNLSCTTGAPTGCSIAFTINSGVSSPTDPATPVFDFMTDTITTGALYDTTNGISVPDQQVTKIKFMGFDPYGNREGSSHLVSYNVDSNIPTVAISGSSRGAVGVSGIFRYTDLTWTSSRTGLPFRICVGPTGCGTGSAACAAGSYSPSDGLGAGTITTGTMTTRLNASTAFPWAGSSNDVRVCVYNLVDALGASIYTTLARYDVGPTLNFSPAPGTYTNPQSLTITCSGHSCDKIYLTDDGSALTTDSLLNDHIAITNGTEYTGAISLPLGTTRIRVKAYDAAGNWSTNDLDGTFTVNP